MKDIIYDVLVSALIMSLITTTVIPIFRNNTEQIYKIAPDAGDTGCEFAPCLDIGNGTVSIMGFEAISLIRYYEGKDITVIVSMANGQTETYQGSTYIREDFLIPYNCIFRCCFEYEGMKLARIQFTEEAG